MANKRIALDVDGVLADFYMEMCLKYGMPYAKISDWNVGWIIEKFNEVVDDEDFWMHMSRMPNIDEIDFDVYCYLTALPPQMKKAREFWIKVNGLPDAPVVVSDDKFEYCCKNEIDFLVDDKPATVLEFRENESVYSPKIIYFMPNYYTDEMKIEGVRTAKNLKEVKGLI